MHPNGKVNIYMDKWMNESMNQLMFLYFRHFHASPLIYFSKRKAHVCQHRFDIIYISKYEDLIIGL